MRCKPSSSKQACPEHHECGLRLSFLADHPKQWNGVVAAPAQFHGSCNTAGLCKFVHDLLEEFRCCVDQAGNLQQLEVHHQYDGGMALIKGFYL